ncbi:LysR family transcriptional regulator [uncultured Pelagimonas sp.]|uniref:LysR family transcriptional regulator n=1 Tax=uncultured Pelagimonas sp. TaxID=1618102 RepID=UPI00260C1E10|nr:LysR family transcriptional regulator [uncultured Pelagimonas sp.]
MDAHWDDLKTVMVLVQRRSLAEAAKVLGISYTTVARRVTRLETQLQQGLFIRQPDGYQPTEAGLLVAKHAEQMQAAEHDMMRGLTGGDTRLQGKLTVTAPQLMIAYVFAPVLKQFQTAHPAVDLQIRATNDVLDLTRREADLAIRVSRSPGDSLTGLRLAEQETASFATQEWADRYRSNPQGPMDWIVYAAHKSLPEMVLEAAPGSRICFRFDDMVAMAGAAQAGLGVVRMPVFLGRALPGLVQLPILPPQPYADIWVVGHPDVWPSARVTAFREMLVPFMRAKRAEFVG